MIRHRRNQQQRRWRVAKMTAAFDQAALRQQQSANAQAAEDPEDRCVKCGDRIPDGQGRKDTNSRWYRVYCREACWAMRDHMRL